ncbi:MAG: glycosyltransferase [Coriobacteriales bacterium]|nr:glycosyltransferase [Coriobacteriales bacterium]
MAKRPTKILLFSASFGGGHKAAAEALLRYFEERHGGDVEVRIVDFFREFLPSVNVLGRFAYDQSVTFFPTLYGNFFELSNRLPTNPVVHELKTTGYFKASRYIDEFEPDAIVSTFPVAGGVVADMKEDRPVVAATVITDFGVHRAWLHPSTDLYFVPSKEVREDLVVRGVPWNRVVVSGIPVAEKFSATQDKAAARRDLGLADRFTVIVTSAAGSVSDLREIVGQLGNSGVQVLAVTGRNTRMFRRLEPLCEVLNLVRVFAYRDDMDTIMHASDLLVGKAGGLTVSEALAVGMPLIIYNPVPGQEMYNVDFLVNYGAGMWARDAEDVVEKVRFLATHPTRLSQMAENAATLGRPKAVQTIAERVLAAVER